METVSWPEGTQNQAFGVQPSKSSMQNYSSFQCVKTRGWFNGNLNIDGSQAQPAPSNSSTGTVRYLGNGQFNGNYWDGKAPDLVSAQNSNSFGAQKNGNRIYDSLPQLLLKDQALMTGSGNRITPSRPYVPQSQYATQNTPLSEKVFSSALRQMMANGANPLITHTTTENRDYNSQEQLQFSDVGKGAHTTGTQGHGNFRANQHSQRRMGSWQGVTFTHYSNPMARKANTNCLQTVAAVGQGLMSSGYGAGETSQRKSMNGTVAAVAIPAGEISNVGQVLAGRGNKMSENPTSVFPSVSQIASSSNLPGMMNRNQGPVVNPPTATGYSPSGQNSPKSSWSASRTSPISVTGHSETSSELDTMKMALLSLIMKYQTVPPGKGSESGTVSMVPERAHDAQHRSSAATGASLGSLNLPCYLVNENQNISQLDASRNASGNSSSVQNVMEQQPYCHYPNSNGVGNFASTPSCAGNQGSHFSLTVQQPLGVEDQVRRIVQEAEYQAQSCNRNAQLSCFFGALNRSAARHIRPNQTMELAPNQCPVSSVESYNGNPLHALSISSRRTSYISNQAKQPHSQLRDDHPASDPPSYPVQQPPGAENHLRRNVQETKYQTYNENAQHSCFSRTSNKCVSEEMSHIRPTQTVEQTPKPIPVSFVESHNGSPASVLNASSRCTSYFSNQAKQPHSQLRDEHPARDPPPYHQTHRYFVTVTEDRLGDGFPAKNVILMDNQPANHASALRDQLQRSSTEKTAKMNCRPIFGDPSGKSNRKKHEMHQTHSTAMISTAEAVFNMPKSNNQQKCTGSSGQRAVAVVPPISQQSSYSVDQGSGILNADDGLPFKIQKTWSLTEDEYATQHKMDIAVSVSLPHDMGSDMVVHNVSTASAPAMDIVSLPPTEQTGSPFEKMAQTSYSVEPATSSTTGVSSVVKMDVNTSNSPDLEPQPITVTHQTEEISLHSNAYDYDTPSLDIIESGEKNGISEKNKFDLSSVPVYEWTSAKLNIIASVIECKQKPLDLEIDIDKLIRVFGVCGYDNSDIFSSDHYTSIMNEASSIAAQDEHSVVFSQIKRKCLEEVKQNCQIIQHGDTFSDMVYKSSWLNLNEHLDDIDKEHGLPFHLRFGKRTPEEYESKELNESNCKPAKAPKEQAQMHASPILSQAEQQASSDQGVRNFQDPLSFIEISVLSPEDARRFFNGEQTRDEKTVVLQSELPEPDSEEIESQMQVELPEQPFEVKEKNQMAVYCCLARWISVITDCGKNTVCSCQSEVELGQEKDKTSANPADAEKTNCIVGPFSSAVGEGCSMDVGNSFFVQKTGTADQQVKKVKDMSDKCSEPEHGSVVYQVQDTVHQTKKKNAEPPREQKPETCVKSPSGHSIVENEDDFETLPPAVPSGSNVEVEIQGIYSNRKEVLKIASVMLKPLWSKCISEDECKNSPCANIDVKKRYGAKGTGHVSLGYDEAGAKCGTFGQPRGKDLASNENHNQGNENIRKGERKCKKRRWEISNPESKSSVCDYLPHSLKRSNKLEKSCHRAVCEIKTTTEDCNDETPLQEKRERDHHSESLKSKTPELVEGQRRRNIQTNKGENGKIPRKGNVSEVLPTLKEKACSVSLTLYGSSSRKRNGTLRSHRALEWEPFKGRSCVERIPLPPTTISLTVTSKTNEPFKNTLPVKGLAKQQVFASWKSSLVTTKCGSQPKTRGSKRTRKKGLASCKYDGAAKIPGAFPTVHPNQPGLSTGQTSANLFHRKVPPVQLRAVKKGKSSMPKSARNEPLKPAAHKANQTTSAERFVIEGKPSDLTARPIPLSKTMFLNKLKLKTKPTGVEPVHQWRQSPSVSSLHEAETKSKRMNGNSALIPLQKESNILEFKLLPKSFSFKDCKDYKESVNPRPAKKTLSAEVSGKQSDSLKKQTWKLRGSWSKSSEGKGMISSEVRSPSATMQSGTIFQEYKKRYMAKGKK